MQTLQPIFQASVGFDRLLIDLIRSNASHSYPPLNIEAVDENKYKISIALAGFKQDELSLETNNNFLVIRGKKAAEVVVPKFLHQGIAARDFERKFHLAEHVSVQSANYENGLLSIDLMRVIPDALLPRKIPIGAANSLESAH
jgi:molecular chaperone IbpA